MIFHNILLFLQRTPSISLELLSQELQVSRRTIQKAIVMSAGKNFRDLREEILISRVKTLFLAKPHLTIRALSFAVGYESPRSFARAIRRACGSSPEELRCSTGKEVLNRLERTISLEPAETNPTESWSRLIEALD